MGYIIAELHGAGSARAAVETVTAGGMEAWAMLLWLDGEEPSWRPAPDPAPADGDGQGGPAMPVVTGL